MTTSFFPTAPQGPPGTPPPPAQPSTSALSTPGCVGWYDASVGSSVVVSGGAVSQWSDLSGHSNHLLQATSGNRPTYVGPWSNNLPALLFTAASSQFMTLAAWDVGQIAQATILVVLDVTVGAINPVIYDGIDNTHRMEMDVSSTFLNMTGGVAMSAADAFPLRATPCQVACLYNAGGSQMWSRGTLAKIGDAGTNVLAGLTLGALNGGASFFHDGHIGELVVYRRPLRASEMDAQCARLAAKWALAS